jgi:hypothetical protein
MIYIIEQAYFSGGMPDVVLVGRIPGCDIEMPIDLTTVSRLHAVIFALPRHARIVVIDVGSFMGIRTIWRSGKAQPCSDHDYQQDLGAETSEGCLSAQSALKRETHGVSGAKRESQRDSDLSKEVSFSVPPVVNGGTIHTDCTTATTTSKKDTLPHNDPTTTTSILEKDTLPCSVPHARMPLQFHWGESVTMQIGRGT